MLNIDCRNQIDASFHVLRQFELKSDKNSVGRKIPEFIFFSKRCGKARDNGLDFSYIRVKNMFQSEIET